MDPVGLRELYDHHAWSMERLLVRALEVPPEASRPDALSLRDMLAHIVSAESHWLARLQVRERAYSAVAETVAEVQHRWIGLQSETRAFLADLGEAEAGRFLRMPRAFPAPFDPVVGRTRQTLAASVAHVLLHAAQHRAEAAVLLSDCGRSPGELDYIDFLEHREALLRIR